MRNRVLRLASLGIAALLVAQSVPAVERDEVPEQYRWDLTSLFADEAAWVAARQELARDIPSLARWQGRLGESPATLLAALQDIEGTRRRTERLYAYAFQLYDQDTRVGRHQQMQQEAVQLYTELGTATAFVRPEILAVGRPAVERMLAAEPQLAQYRMPLDGLYLCGAGTHPGGGVSGAAGRNAAKCILREKAA